MLTSSLGLCAQEGAIDLKQALLLSPVSEPHKDHAQYFRQADNEVEMLYAGMFVFYKSFISSQDGSTCSFAPSCSEYAVQAVKKFGPIRGGMAFFDRYSRCNSLSPAFYQKDAKRKKLIDEVGEF